jgi:hypothetical protein
MGDGDCFVGDGSGGTVRAGCGVRNGRLRLLLRWRPLLLRLLLRLRLLLLLLRLMLLALCPLLLLVGAIATLSVAPAAAAALLCLLLLLCWAPLAPAATADGRQTWPLTNRTRPSLVL